MPSQRRRIRRSRGRGLRTTSGWRRHLKCDEIKPICGPCAKNDKLCEYAASARRSSPQYSGINDVARPVIPETLSPQQANQNSLNGYLTKHAQRDNPEGNDLHRASFEPELSPSPSAHLADSDIAPNQSPIAPQNNYLSPSNASFAAAQWFGLLASDAARDSPQLQTVSDTVPNTYATQILALDDSGTSNETEPSSLQRATQVLDSPHPGTSVSQEAAECGVPGGHSLREVQFWQAQGPIELLPAEQTLFEHFVYQIDLFDPMSQFSTLVSHLALRNAGLMNAILALAFRHLALNPRLDTEEMPNKEQSALQYYYQTLHYVQRAMQYSSYKTSLELLATTLIISAYEMLDNSTNDWERHLEGVFLIQRSQVIHGESGGLHSAVWWAWLCQDIWAAFREKRKTLTFWVPQKPLSVLSPYELASRAIYITAKVVTYCAESTAMDNIQHRIEGAMNLRIMLDDWKRHLSLEFSPLPLGPKKDTTSFQPVWIRPPAFAVAIQFFSVSRMLLIANEPNLGGLDQYMDRQNVIKHCVEDICGIAMTLKDTASSLMSSQALFIGM
ncbi:D-aminoacid aminotransferase-like PLP-dependent enzyme [Penicillium atrosanguineum]|uniref:D-aminoacid aminotransferase-like PLP-dependent enzyme n=1 Tax=Penicillium atrosanguineum TaxID=1132637 RepID=UPI00238787DC|nr:D-aminoacid aminotransferase-like PLP-dependent enzyme [Penicillium atrosanguineum]KAJ5300446.1 D-aminoacid aminotransferase-like PLP-dependent enzyme [Penicillium atrosanguineum]